jgi:uncharacterized membrane protein HdeD (DUF308 family)
MKARMQESGAMRQRYFVFVSVVYVVLGVVIVARSALAGAIPVGILGVVFVALGAVRLRDYFTQREQMQ